MEYIAFSVAVGVVFFLIFVSNLAYEMSLAPVVSKPLRNFLTVIAVTSIMLAVVTAFVLLIMAVEFVGRSQGA